MHFDHTGLKPIQSMAATALFKYRRLLLCLPRQEGKTELGVRLNADLLGRDFAKSSIFLAKDHKSGKRATREKFYRLCPKERFAVNTETVYLKKNPLSICYMESVDKDPDRLRGGTYSFIHGSETAFWKLEHGVKTMDVYDKVIKPTATKTNGYIFLESTNNGLNGWYDIWENYKELGFHRLRIPLWMMAEMGLVTEEYYNALKADTLPLTFLQEYECEFMSPKGKVYEEFNETHIQPVRPPEPWQKVVMAIDWGFDPSATCVLFGYVHEGILYIFAEHYAKRERTDITKDRIYDILGAAFVENFSAVADHEEDRIEELIRAKIPCSKASKIDVLGARIEIKTKFFKNQIVIDPSCVNLIRELHSAVWDERPGKDGEIDFSQDTKGHFDAEAALRYLTRELSNAESEEPEFNPHALIDQASAREFRTRNVQKGLFDGHY